MPLDAPVTNTIMEATASLRSPVLDRQFRRRMPFQPIGQRRVHACLPARAGGAEGSQNIGSHRKAMAILGSPETGGLPRLRLSVLRCARISALASGASSSSAGSSPRAIAARTRAQSVLLSPRAHAARISSSVIVVSFEPLIVYLSVFPARWPETDDSRCVAFGKNNRYDSRYFSHIGKRLNSAFALAFTGDIHS